MTPFRIVLVTGGRKFRDTAYACHQLEAHHANPQYGPFGLLVHGGADGLDLIADAWAKSVGVHTARVDALWNWYRKQGRPRYAGVARNSIMLKLPIDLVLAFPGGHGTANQVLQTQRRIKNGARIELINLADDWRQMRQRLEFDALASAIRGLE